MSSAAPTAGTNLAYFDPQIETLPRDQLQKLQELRLLGILPYVYERSPLIRQVWESAGVHPSEIRSLADFFARVPFIDKDAIRGFRDANDDPCGGIRVAEYTDIPHVGFTSGTTGDPTPVPDGKGTATEPEVLREFWQIGARGGDYVTYMMFTFRGGIGRINFLGDAGITPIAAAHDPAVLPLMIEAIETYRPTVMYMLSTPMMIGLEAYFAKSDKDPREVFRSVKGAVFGGEPMSPRFQALARSWGLEIFDYTSFGDVTGAMECREHNGFHGWEDLALAECVDADGRPVADGDLGELVVTSLTDPWAPLIRYRTGDLVKIDRSQCGCGRTHLRFWTLGRMGDQTLVQGVSVLPRDIQAIVEQQPETKAALFQIIRPQAEMPVLRLRVGFDEDAGNPPDLAGRLTASVTSALGVPCEVELVPNADLLKLGPPQKIPRVTKQ